MVLLKIFVDKIYGHLQQLMLQISSNINEAIKATLNSFIQKLENHKKAQNGQKQTKIKNAPKNI